MTENPNVLSTPGKAKKICWMTDVHFDHADDEELPAICQEIVARNTDVLLISGDISNSELLIDTLEYLAEHIRVPIYFVLGNHDYYGTTFSELQKQVRASVATSDYLHWLPDCGVVPLDDTTCLLGSCGWADGILGAGRESQIEVNDHYKIKDFIDLDTGACFDLMASLGNAAAKWFQLQLATLPHSCTRILVVTHVPPFEEAAYYHGSAEREDYLPFYCCHQVGLTLRKFMANQPGRVMQVFCGHTHTAMEVTVRENLTVRTGKSVYASPAVQDYFRL